MSTQNQASHSCQKQYQILLAATMYNGLKKTGI